LQRCFAAAASDENVSYTIPYQFKTHNIDPPSQDVETTKCECPSPRTVLVCGKSGLYLWAAMGASFSVGKKSRRRINPPKQRSIAIVQIIRLCIGKAMEYGLQSDRL
jgi:hypothetical protein